MKPIRYPVNMITGEYATLRQSHTIITQSDDSLEAIPQASYENYSVLQPHYRPKGPTNRVIKLEGNNRMENDVKLFGSGNTMLHGKPYAYIQGALQSGFDVYTVNVRPDDATHANFYLALEMRLATDEDLVLIGDTSGDLNTKLFIEEDNSGGTTHTSMSYDKTSLPNAGTITEVELPKVIVGFVPYYIENLATDKNYDEMVEEHTIAEVKVGDVLDDKSKISIPLFGLAYTGASDYGNNYILNIKDTKTLADEKYPVFNMDVLDKKTSEYSFGFMLFDNNHNGENYGFKDRTYKKCSVKATLNNVMEVFKGFNVDRGVINAFYEDIMKFRDVIIADAARRVKIAMPGLDVTDTEGNDFESYVAEPIRSSFSKIAKPKRGTNETILSNINMFKSFLAADTNNLLPVTCPAVVNLTGGSDGCIKELLENNDFSYDLKVEIDGEQVKIFEKLFIDAITGKMDPAMFDMVLVWDCILFGDGYTTNMQKAIIDFCKYREDVNGYEKGRSDWYYFCTPEPTRKVISAILGWFNILEEKKNHNVSLVIGRGRFHDASSGSQIMFELLFEYLGKGGTLWSALNSGTTDSIAATAISEVTKVAPNSFELIPDNTTDREDLTNTDIMYYKRNGRNNMVLGNDTNIAVGFTSDRKYAISGIQFNRAMNIAYRVLEIESIKNPTVQYLKDLQDDVEKAVSGPAKHFANRMQVTVGMSTKEEEIGKKVVLCQISINGNQYSRVNRLHMKFAKNE